MSVEQDLPLQDREILAMPEDLRKDIATGLASNLYSFCTGVLGYVDLTPSAHGALCAFHDKNPARFKHTEMPRDHLKTTICTIGKNIQRIVKNPNRRILILNETSTNAERFAGAIKQHAEGNRIFRALYSSVIPKNPRQSGKAWNNQELEFNREWIGPEPTIDTMGMTGAVTSRHYTDISIDDPISEEAVKSELVMRDAINRIKKVLTLMVNPNEDSFDLTGTRWALHDLYRVFMENYRGSMALFIRGAIENGLPIWPERFSLETLAQMRTDMGAYAFSCMMMNNPRDADKQSLNVNDIRYWDWADVDQTVIRLFKPDGTTDIPLKALDVTCALDPAPAEKLKDDQNGITVTGTTREGDAIVLEAFGTRDNPVEVINHLFRIHERYKVRLWGIEGIAYQKAFKYFLAAEAVRRGKYFEVFEIKASNKSKPERIKGLSPVLATGHLYIHATQMALRLQIDEFPLCKLDDILDSLSMHLQMWRDVMSSRRWEKYQKSEKELLRRLHQENLRLVNNSRSTFSAGLEEQRLAAKRLRDPAFALHEDDVEEPGWTGVRLG
ncbi:MAG TPA: hypothetical protein VIY48_21885 [Candidatus Paceibacterota bacterium]